MPDQGEEAKGGSGRLDEHGYPIHTQTERFHIDGKEGKEFVRRQANELAERYKAVEPQLEDIRRLESDAQSAQTIYEKQAAETELTDRVKRLSERTGLSEDAIAQQLREERRLQGEGKAEELARVRREFDANVKAAWLGVSPEEMRGSVVSGPVAPGRFGGSRGGSVPSLTEPRPRTESRPPNQTAPGRFGGSRGGGPR